MTAVPTTKPPEIKEASSPPSLFAVADFCLIPIGTGSASVGEQIAECARVLQGFKSQGLVYKMHGYGTNLEGSWQLVSSAIEACHRALHERGVPRIATDIRIGTTDGKRTKPSWAASLGENERKLESVQRRLKDVSVQGKPSEPSEEDALAQRAVREDAKPARPSNAELRGFD